MFQVNLTGDRVPIWEMASGLLGAVPIIVRNALRSG